MNTLKITGISLVLAGVLLSGCGLSSDSLSYQSERAEALFASAWSEERGTLFAADLSVIEGDTDDSDTGVDAEAAGVFGVNNRTVVFKKNPYERLYPASITKVMTALVALKYGNLDDQVTVGQEVVITEPGSSMCNIKPGETLSMRELLYGLLLPSGNDAAAAIAVHMSGNEEAFCKLMNQEAKAVGATDSHFMNPHGLPDENHYTTVYDLYLIFREAFSYPEFREIIGTSTHEASYTDAGNNPTTQTWKNSNRYLSGEAGTPAGLTVLGGKTGTTKAAGYCLIMASMEAENEEPYISVVLKAENRSKLYDNMTNIIYKIVN